MACKLERKLGGKQARKLGGKPEGKLAGNRSSPEHKQELGCSKQVVVHKPALGCSKQVAVHRQAGKRDDRQAGKQDDKRVGKRDDKRVGKRACNMSWLVGSSRFSCRTNDRTAELQPSCLPKTDL